MMGKILRLLLFLLSSFVFNDNIKAAAAAAAPTVASTQQKYSIVTIENRREDTIKIAVFYRFPDKHTELTTTINIPPGGEAELPIKVESKVRLTRKGETETQIITFSHYVIYYKDKDEYSIWDNGSLFNSCLEEKDKDVVGKRLCFTNDDTKPIITSGEATVATTPPSTLPPAAASSPIKIEKGNFLIVNNLKGNIMVMIDYYDIKMKTKKCIEIVNVRPGHSAKFSTVLPDIIIIDPLSELIFARYSIMFGYPAVFIEIDSEGVLDKHFLVDGQTLNFNRSRHFSEIISHDLSLDQYLSLKTRRRFSEVLPDIPGIEQCSVLYDFK